VSASELVSRRAYLKAEMNVRVETSKDRRERLTIFL
jgi:hypothetical protein